MRHDPRNRAAGKPPATRMTVLAAALLLLPLAVHAQAGPDTAAGAPASWAAPAPLAPATVDSVDEPAAPRPSNVRTDESAQGARLIVASKRVRLAGKSDNVVRSGPGSAFAIVGVYPKGATFHVIARNGDWYGIRLSDTETGWIHSSLCRELDDLSGLEFKPNPKLYTRTGSYVLSGYGGAYAFDRKSNSLVLGGRIGYYVFDRLQAEAGVSWTHVRRGPEVVESLFGLSLEAEDFHMAFYHLGLLWELLPGRQMVPFIGAGVGSTIMLGRSESSYDFGAGTMLFLSRRSAVRWEVRDFRFRSGPDAARLTNDNIEFTLGSEILF